MSKAKITVIGAGLMGHGIAQGFRAPGHDGTITDSVKQNLDTAKTRIAANLRDLGDDEKAVDNVHVRADLAKAVRDADYVVEAVLEDLPLKQKLFAENKRHVRPDTILASKTSVITIPASVQEVKQRERALGTHWWNPPFLVPLVEVIETEWTSPEVVAWTMKLHEDAGKTPAHVKKDVPGFIGNRLQHALWREAIFLIEEGICDAETVDTVVKASFGMRLPVLGPLENADLVGTDLTLAVHEHVLPDLDRTPGPLPYLRHLVEAGRLGMKSGSGFRTWTEEQKAEVRAKLQRHLKAMRGQ